MSSEPAFHESPPESFSGIDAKLLPQSQDEIEWQAMLHQLVCYRIQHGHCFVPKDKRRHPELRHWLEKQVALFHQGRLSQDRKRELEALGWEWEALHEEPARKSQNEVRWEARFAEMVAFKKEHGHLRVTLTNQPSPGLMHWRDNQRIRFQAGTLTTVEKAKLDSIGFEWEPPQRINPALEKHNVELWERKFAMLLDFRAAHGHCQVPKSDKQDSTLSSWVQAQRIHYSKNTLLPERQRRLEEIGFAWKSDRKHFLGGWETRFAEMVAFKEKHGHLRITDKNKTSPGLMHWRDNQRIRCRKGVMTADQRAKLDSIGFEWEAPKRISPALEDYNVELWERMFAELLAFREAHGHCQVAKSGKTTSSLASWVRAQRNHYRKKTLLPERQRRLEEIGFAWKSDGKHFLGGWERRFAEMVAFKEKHGHLRITDKNQSSPGLTHWRDNQRIRCQKGVLTPDQRAKLDSIGFEWEAPKRINPALEAHNVELWERMFAELLAFREAHGHCQVAKSGKTNSSLASWVRSQRKHYRKKTLLPERQRRLEEIGFAWKSDRLHFAASWEARFVELAAFKKKYGHLRVTGKNQPSPGFTHWRDNQRIRFRSGVMSAEQKAMLDTLGFEWENTERLSPAKEEHNVALWETMFARLKEFRDAHGHCQVTLSKSGDLMLGSWVKRQRFHYRKNTLLPERRMKLEEIGFERQSEKLHLIDAWEARFAELVAFKQKHGHLQITRTNESSGGLSHWRDYQRFRFQKGVMKPEQKARLDAIGFEWGPPGMHTAALNEHQEAQWQSKYKQLAAFKERQGHARVPKKWKENPGLGQWLSEQRKKYRRGSGEGGLRPERLAILDALGTEWREPPPKPDRSPLPAVLPNDPKAKWENRYARLVEFHRQNGHSNVPGHPDRLLRKWVLEQRLKHEEGRLEPEQITRLEALGFSWVTPNLRSAASTLVEKGLTIWEQRFNELEAFAAERGHFRVPKYEKEFKTLYSWAKAQRVYRRRGSLTPDHFEKLEAIGFPWEPGLSSEHGYQTMSWNELLRNLLASNAR